MLTGLRLMETCSTLWIPMTISDHSGSFMTTPFYSFIFCQRENVVENINKLLGDEFSKSSAGEASTAAVAPKCILYAANARLNAASSNLVCLGPGCIFTLTAIAKWECSSYGRVLALHARGTG
ncbi:hypothetical protein Tco_1536160, partial [Tanacetum coccineum]